MAETEVELNSSERADFVRDRFREYAQVREEECMTEKGVNSMKRVYYSSLERIVRLTMHNADDPDTSSPMELLGKRRESAQQDCASNNRTRIERTMEDIMAVRRMMRLWIF